jgi:hypothetical protein
MNNNEVLHSEPDLPFIHEHLYPCLEIIKTLLAARRDSAGPETMISRRYMFEQLRPRGQETQTAECVVFRGVRSSCQGPR